MMMAMPPQPAFELSWRSSPEPVFLSPEEVHVWRASLDVELATVERLQQTLSADELARAAKFYSAIDSARYIVGRGILRALLARYLGRPAGDVRFSFNAHGKPALAPSGGTGDLRFNLSHSHGMALFAFADRYEVGVDLEHVRPMPANERLVERFFSPQEVAALRALPEDAQSEAFFHCWTRKEAYIKARGGGLSISLASFTVSLAPSELNNLPVTGDDDPEASGWSLRALAPGEGYVGAVAARGTDWRPALWQWV
jgi:4'-phosphopantetheinyl transferase